MTTERGPVARRLPVFAAGLVCVTALTFWLGLRATRGWQQSTREASDTRANEVAALLSVALERDMKGGQVSVLVPFNESLVNSPPYELADRFARGFARFPYLDSFYVWTEGGGPSGSTYVFSRADRQPRWDKGKAPKDPVPVVFRQDPDALGPLVRRVRTAGRDGARFAFDETTIDDAPYQSVAQMMYEGDGAQAHLAAIVGFLVDVDWVRQRYFGDFIRQIQDVIGDRTLNLEIHDETGSAVAAVGTPAQGARPHQRTFGFAFADRAMIAEVAGRSTLRQWTARVSVGDEATLTAASQGAFRTLILLALGATATIVGLWFTVRAAKAAADLAETQAEFVSSVSHEMKTPLSLVKLASDTLANGRYSSPSAVTEYSRMINVEAQHLTRLIDNVLCYARLNDRGSSYDIEPVDVVDLVQESMDRFAPRLAAMGIEADVHVPSDPVVVTGDHFMLQHAFDNLVENAITHAGEGRWLGVRVVPGDSLAIIEVADRGEGIPADELTRVFDKFYRRKGTRQRGTGLGLAIVRRIVEDLGGRVELASAEGAGTTARMTLVMVTAQV
ncbi:MAG: HAMP domain-containing sensor histidine kinase [Vicinamibacterales bacterium]